MSVSHARSALTSEHRFRISAAFAEDFYNGRACCAEGRNDAAEQGVARAARGKRATGVKSQEVAVWCHEDCTGVR